jgi:hypothetical protein
MFIPFVSGFLRDESLKRRFGGGASKKPPSARENGGDESLKRRFGGSAFKLPPVSASKKPPKVASLSQFLTKAAKKRYHIR